MNVMMSKKGQIYAFSAKIVDAFYGFLKLNIFSQV